MQIKRFEAKNMTTALRMIKDELGPDAVILSARSLRKGKGFFGSMKYAGVEVSAAIDNQLLPGKKITRTGRNDAYPDMRKSRFGGAGGTGENANVLPAGYSAYSQSYRQRSNSGDNANSRKNYKALSSLYQQILTQEVDRSIASELIEELKRIPATPDILAEEDLKSYLVSILEEMGALADINAFKENKLQIAAFVGTTGVGKTTTIAKLAALQTNRNKKRIALVTLDNYSIAAMAQLKAYAKILGIPLEPAVNIAELKRAIKKFKDQDLIFIDTPGINPKNREMIDEFKRYFAKIGNLQTHLVLSATTKEQDLLDAAGAFKDLGVHRLVFTKIDESSTIGNIVNLLIKTEVPLSFLCGGRRVPDDIEAGSIEMLADLLLKSLRFGSLGSAVSTDTTASQKTSVGLEARKKSFLVANKNSDVYHCPDCRWSKKIKPENIVRFTNAQAAEAQNFLPCSSCKPDRLQSGNQLSSTTEKRNLSSYR